MNPDNVKIRVENLKKDFGSLKVLQDVSAEICEGEVVVVIGPSGSGKSTFLRCLNMLEETTAGRIQIDGQECISASAVRRPETAGRHRPVPLHEAGHHAV